MEEVIKALIEMTRVSHHNASVFSLAKHRKEKADGNHVPVVFCTALGFIIATLAPDDSGE